MIQSECRWNVVNDQIIIIQTPAAFNNQRSYGEKVGEKWEGDCIDLWVSVMTWETRVTTLWFPAATVPAQLLLFLPSCCCSCPAAIVPVQLLLFLTSCYCSCPAAAVPAQLLPFLPSCYCSFPAATVPAQTCSACFCFCVAPAVLLSLHSRVGGNDHPNWETTPPPPTELICSVF